ncbi:MAG: cytochrome bc complex cytochrome b subunit [Actinomycetota bacterium]|nr:cytochrome bc complex cytochrome b subunit [Actinomycetota bacterium]
MIIRKALDGLDDRLGTNSFAQKALNKVFPDHWSFLLGEVVMYCLVVLIATGTYLSFFFVPSAKSVTYHGSYRPLRGLEMSQAYQSTVRLSFDVRAGLLIRQMHHWAALLFVAALIAHVLRIFFTGAYRKPRELNWLIGVTLLLLAIFNGFSGYSLPDDLLSGTGLRIAYSSALAVPVIGTWIAFLVFGGEFPSPDLTSRLFVLHILLVPGLIIGLLTAHLAMVWRQKHTQFPGPGHTEENVVGTRLWPTYTARALGLFAGVSGVIALLGGLVQINPVWLYGPFDPAAVTTAAQPDWYMGWLEGAFRLMPPARTHIFGYELSELFVPGVVLPGITFGLLYAWPFLERRITKDRAAHNLLLRPSDHPWRTSFGWGAITFYVVLFVAGSQDIISQHLRVPIARITTVFQVLLFALPVMVGLLTARICHDLRGKARLERRKEEVRQQGPPPAKPPAPEASAPS